MKSIVINKETVVAVTAALTAAVLSYAAGVYTGWKAHKKQTDPRPYWQK